MSGASPLYLRPLLRRLAEEVGGETFNGFPDFEARTLAGSLEIWASERAAGAVYDAALDTPAYKRDAVFAAAVDRDAAAVRKEIAAAFRTIRRLTKI